jgi:hypothetical protein
MLKGIRINKKIMPSEGNIFGVMLRVKYMKNKYKKPKP